MIDSLIRDSKVTLYDIFGFFLPGTVFYAALAIFYWSVSMPVNPQSLSLMKFDWVVFLISSYLLGHFSHGLASQIAEKTILLNTPLFGVRWPFDIQPELIDAVKLKLENLFGIPRLTITNQTLYFFCDETVCQRGVSQEREIYQYRDGFYRAMAVSLLALLLSVLCRWIVPGATLVQDGLYYPVSCIIYVLLLALITSFILVCRFRYYQFRGYRVKRALTGFLIIEQGRING